LFSGEYQSVFIKNNPTMINTIRWNGEYWLMGGSSATSGRHILQSYDGVNWIDTNTATHFAGNDSCNGMSWNGSLWVVSGTTDTNTRLLYSYDGQTWTQSSTILGGGKVEWNGSIFLCAGPAESSGNTNITNSSDGIHWTTTNIGSYGNVNMVITNGTTWVLSTTQTDGSGVLLVSYNGTNWIADAPYSAGTYCGGTWTGSCFVVNTSTNAIRISYDGREWTTVATAYQSGKDVLYSSPEKGVAEIQQPTIVGGIGNTHTMAYSLDGILYNGIGRTIFTSGCSAIHWNNGLWVAGGIGGGNNNAHTLAYSLDGIQWVGLGKSVFSEGCYAITHNRDYWLAMGSGGNTIAKSTDGKSWTGINTSVFDGSGFSADWNGYRWIAGGKGASHTLATSTDGIVWSGLGNTVFSDGCNSVRWMMSKWVAVGNGGNTIAYTEDQMGSTGWTGYGSSIFSMAGNDVFWNGSIAVAVGSGGNTIATSTDGVTWTGKGSNIFSSQSNSVMWNTKRWIATGSGGNTVATSIDGNGWYASPDTNMLFIEGITVGTNSRIGTTMNHSGIRLHANDRFSVNTPRYYDSGLSPDTVVSFQMNI
jgi:hypothetical protein